MTPKEAELLRAVAKSVERYREAFGNETLLPSQKADVAARMFRALSVYRAQPQEAEGETVEAIAHVWWHPAHDLKIISGSREQYVPSTDWQYLGSMVGHFPPIPTIPAKVET